MKKIYFTLVLLFLILRSATAQYYNQYFDGADTSVWNSILIDIDQDSSNVWQIGTPQKFIFDSASTLPNAIVTDTINFYPTNDTSSFIAKVWLSWGNWGIFALQWNQKLDMDTSFDGGIIEYSIDSGNTWVNVMNNPYVYNFYGFDSLNLDTLSGGEYAFSGTDSSWKNIWLCFDLSWLTQFGNYDTLLFRFTMLSDSIDNHKEGWMIDNMLAYITVIHTVKESNLDKYINVFPNPATNIVHIRTEKIMDYHIIERMELVDAMGRVAESWTNIPTKFWFDVSKYPAGLYYLKIKTNLKSENVPLVISK